MIQNIVLDLGNVIINLDMPATDRELRKLVPKDWLRLHERNQVKGTYHAFETGKLSEREFLSSFQEGVDDAPDHYDLRAAWNAMLLDVPPKRIAMLEALAEIYDLYLLSNTNETHMDFIREYLEREHGITDFDSYFEKAYYSQDIQRRKPDVATYEWVSRDAGIDPAATLFIDDNEQNIAGAQAAGWQVQHHPVGAEITDYIQQYIRQAG